MKNVVIGILFTLLVLMAGVLGYLMPGFAEVRVICRPPALRAHL
jgi:hypothetical protein